MTVKVRFTNEQYVQLIRACEEWETPPQTYATRTSGEGVEECVLTIPPYNVTHAKLE